MNGANHLSWLLGMLAAFFLGTAPAVSGATEPQSAKERFYEAYFLEKEQGDSAAALALYEAVAADTGADPDLRARARARIAACQEDVRATDFADLMPPGALFYAEINRPGDKLQELLDQLGLLSVADEALARSGRHLSISPALLQEVLGVRGAALAITGFDPRSEEPSGVLVLHPGKVEVVRGFIETALPASADSITSIGGFPTYDIDGEVLVTLTSKLLIASRSRAEIEGVLRRLDGSESQSLSTQPDMHAVLDSRRGDLLFLCANARPMLPMIRAHVLEGARRDPGVAMAQAVFDFESLETLTGRVGVSREGVELEVELKLREGHRNLVFNLARLPGIERESLRGIPGGAAGFVSLALNERTAGSKATPNGGKASDSADEIVTAMDLGREVFGNIVNLSVFALPPARGAGAPIPDLAAVFTVNDPAMTRSLWNLGLGLGHMASGRNSIEGDPVVVHGVDARSFHIEDGPTLYTASVGHDFIVSSSQYALGRCLEARSGGSSILDDATFTHHLESLGQDSTLAAFLHPGRAGQLARNFAPDREFQKLEPFLKRMSETMTSFVVQQSSETLRISSKVTGVPKIGDLFSEAMAERRRLQVARK